MATIDGGSGCSCASGAGPKTTRTWPTKSGFTSRKRNGCASKPASRPARPVASARRDFGNVLRVTELTRSARGGTALEAFVQDIRFSVRLLRRNRVFALFSIASLALGIGATSAIFSLFDAIVLRELPVREPGRLISLSFAMGTGRANNYMPYPHFAHMREANQTLEGLFAWTRAPRISVGFQGREEIASLMRASGDYHPTLGLQPALGRLLTR